MLSQCDQWTSQSDAEIDGQHPGGAVPGQVRKRVPIYNGVMGHHDGAVLGQVREGLERLLEERHRLTERGAVIGLGAGLPAVGHGLVPHLAPQGMVGQAFDLLGHPLGRERLEGLDNAGVEHPPPLLQEAAVGHLVGQGMLEGVLALGKEARLVQELGRLQVRQATVERCLGQLGNGLEQGQGHLRANHGSRLEEAFRLGRQPVDAGRQHRLHRGRHLNGRQRLRQAIGSRLADQHPGLHQGAHALLQKEGIALGARDQELLERRQAGVIPQQGLQELVRAGRRQRVEPQLRVVGLAAPAVLVLRAIVDQEQEAGRGQALDQAVEQGLGLRIDPVQVLEDQQQRLHLAFAQQQALEGVERALAALGRIELQKRAVLRQRVQERQQRWDGVLEGLVQRQAPARSPWRGWCGCHRGPPHGYSA